MADDRSETQKRRDRQLADAESAALAGKPTPRQQPQEKPSGFFETARRALEGFGVKHNVNGKQQDKAP